MVLQEPFKQPHLKKVKETNLDRSRSRLLITWQSSEQVSGFSYPLGSSNRKQRWPLQESQTRGEKWKEEILTFTWQLQGDQIYAIFRKAAQEKLVSTKTKSFTSLMDSQKQTFLKLFLGSILWKVKLVEAGRKRQMTVRASKALINYHPDGIYLIMTELLISLLTSLIYKHRPGMCRWKPLRSSISFVNLKSLRARNPLQCVETLQRNLRPTAPTINPNKEIHRHLQGNVHAHCKTFKRAYRTLNHQKKGGK